MRFNGDYVRQWAKEFGCSFLEELEDEYEIDTCLPTSESDELNARHFDTEDEYYEAAKAYFDKWDADYIRGFCSSIVDKVLVGKFMATYSLIYVRIT